MDDETKRLLTEIKKKTIYNAVKDADVLKDVLLSIDPKKRSPEFYAVKEVVRGWGHWKGLPRGKPRKWK